MSEEDKKDPVIMCSHGHYVRKKEDGVEIGTMVPYKEGTPINDRELVRMTPVGPGMYEAETLYDARGSSTKGPAQVATQQYRDNYDKTFGGN